MGQAGPTAGSLGPARLASSTCPKGALWERAPTVPLIPKAQAQLRLLWGCPDFGIQAGGVRRVENTERTHSRTPPAHCSPWCRGETEAGVDVEGTLGTSNYSKGSELNPPGANGTRLLWLEPRVAWSPLLDSISSPEKWSRDRSPGMGRGLRRIKRGSWFGTSTTCLHFLPVYFKMGSP